MHGPSFGVNFFFAERLLRELVVTIVSGAACLVGSLGAQPRVFFFFFFKYNNIAETLHNVIRQRAKGGGDWNASLSSMVHM